MFYRAIRVTARACRRHILTGAGSPALRSQTLARLAGLGLQARSMTLTKDRLSDTECNLFVSHFAQPNSWPSHLSLLQSNTRQNFESSFILSLRPIFTIYFTLHPFQLLFSLAHIPQHSVSSATRASTLNLSYHPALYFATAYFHLLLFTLSNTSYLPHLYTLLSQSTPNSVVCLIVSSPQHYLSVIL